MKKKVNNCVEIVERDEIVTIDVIKEENLMLNAKKWDLILRKGFLLWKKYPIIGDIRGKGLSIGIELVKNRITKERNDNVTIKITYRCW